MVATWSHARCCLIGRQSGGDREEQVGMKSVSIASRLGVAVAALAGVLVFAQADPALARGGGGGGGGHGGGGGFGGGGHGGGFGGGGFHGGGFAGGFHGGGFRGRGFYGDGFYGGGFGDFDYGYGYGDDSPGYGSYGYSQPYASQSWYYCQSPAGYYPYVPQCSVNWQTVPAG
jgi:hypothetical protein